MLELARSAVEQASSLVRGPWTIAPRLDAGLFLDLRGAEAAS